MMASLSGTMLSSCTYRSAGDMVARRLADPIFGGTTSEGVLAATGGRVALDRMTTGSDEIEQLGELDDEDVVVHAVKGVLLKEVFGKDGLQGKAGQFLPISSPSRRPSNRGSHRAS